MQPTGLLIENRDFSFWKVLVYYFIALETRASGETFMFLVRRFSRSWRISNELTILK